MQNFCLSMSRTCVHIYLLSELATIPAWAILTCTKLNKMLSWAIWDTSSYKIKQLIFGEASLQ